jgi:A/G-specific adenine glycosylase
VHRSRIEAAWPVDEQRERCLVSLVDDGLLVRAGEDLYALP